MESTKRNLPSGIHKSIYTIDIYKAASAKRYMQKGHTQSGIIKAVSAKSHRVSGRWYEAFSQRDRQSRSCRAESGYWNLKSGGANVESARLYPQRDIRKAISAKLNSQNIIHKAGSVRLKTQRRDTKVRYTTMRSPEDWFRKAAPAKRDLRSGIRTIILSKWNL